MSYFDENIYYHPEKHELEEIGQLDDPEASYSFAICAFWKKGKRQVYAAFDSGCSCPSPFEDVTFDMLERISTVEQARRFIEGCESRWMTYPVAEKRDLLKKIGDVLAGREASAPTTS